MPNVVTQKPVVLVPDTHRYHAEAKALSGSLLMPLNQAINPPQAAASLHPDGGYMSQNAGEYHLESVLSYASARTQVSGMKGTKECSGYATLSTVVVEGLNVLEILTCDRIVAQISTVHPLKEHTPEIVFLGTRFENLRIAGHLLTANLNIDAVGPKPGGDVNYLDKPGFLRMVSKQCATLQSYKDLPQPALQRYTGNANVKGNQRSIEFSLVTGITGLPAKLGKAFGHVIHVRHFGDIYLATVKITCDDNKKDPPATTVELKMLELKLGCIAHGTGDVAFAKTNAGKPGG